MTMRQKYKDYAMRTQCDQHIKELQLLQEEIDRLASQLIDLRCQLHSEKVISGYFKEQYLDLVAARTNVCWN